MPRGYGPTVLPLLAWQGSGWCLSFPVCVEGDVGYQPSCGSVWGAEVKGATDETALTIPLLPARAALGGGRFGFMRGWVGKAQPCGQHRVGQRRALESPTPRGLPRHCSALLCSTPITEGTPKPSPTHLSAGVPIPALSGGRTDTTPPAHSVTIRPSLPPAAPPRSSPLAAPRLHRRCPRPGPPAPPRPVIHAAPLLYSSVGLAAASQQQVTGAPRPVPARPRPARPCRCGWRSACWRSAAPPPRTVRATGVPVPAGFPAQPVHPLRSAPAAGNAAPAGRCSGRGRPGPGSRCRYRAAAPGTAVPSRRVDARLPAVQTRFTGRRGGCRVPGGVARVSRSPSSFRRAGPVAARRERLPGSRPAPLPRPGSRRCRCPAPASRSRCVPGDPCSRAAGGGVGSGLRVPGGTGREQGRSMTGVWSSELGSAAGASGFSPCLGGVGTGGEAIPRPRTAALSALPSASQPCGAAGVASPAAAREFPPSPRTMLDVPWGVGAAPCCNGKLSLEEQLDKSVEDKPRWQPRAGAAGAARGAQALVPAARGFCSIHSCPADAAGLGAPCACDGTRIVCVGKERGTGGLGQGRALLCSRVNPAYEGTDSRLAAQDPSLPPSLPSIFRRLANLKHS